ncbi:MAG: hypothetical protein ACR2F8_04105 [Caulobacteraceae bacterium]
MADAGKSAAVAYSDTGKSAALAVADTGKGDDPFLNLALSAGGGMALAAEPGRALAVEILDSWAGKSAARIV